jgi:hypothetical protein
MRRIKIDGSLIKKVESFNNKLFSDKTAAFQAPVERLEKLLEDVTIQEQKDYITKLIQDYRLILNLKPSEFAGKKSEFDGVYTIDGIENSLSTKFGKKIVKALRYDEYRKSQYPRFIHDLGWNLKTCFYCNYSGTLTIKKDKEYKTYYDLDRVLPKHTYPFLATSFFNFIPSCASCNRNKSNHIINGLNPFYEENEINFELEKVFSITSESRAQFYVSNDKEKIQISTVNKFNNIEKQVYANIVDLELLYNSQKHIAEEILWKKKIYQTTYIKQIKQCFQSDILLNEKEINRILWGTDLDDKTINDKPLAKFKYDLIKNS